MRIFNKEFIGEIIRFSVVGVLITVIHYVVYWILLYFINVNIAYSAGYFLSFLANYYLSAHFTFHERTSARNGAGFAGAHVFNYFLQIALFNFFLWIGVHRLLAPFAVLMIAVPTNFVIVRFVFKHFSRKS